MCEKTEIEEKNKNMKWKLIKDKESKMKDTNKYQKE
jgi:hypothetical protein